MFRRVPVAAACLSVLAAIAQAQSGGPPVSAKGTSFGVGVSGTRIWAVQWGSGTRVSDDSGPGVTLAFGWGFSPRLVLFLDGSAALIDSDGERWMITHTDLGLRYLFPLANLFGPFTAGGALRSVAVLFEGAPSWMTGVQRSVDLGGQTTDVELSGLGVLWGAGLQYFAGSRTAFTAGYRATFREFSHRGPFDWPRRVNHAWSNRTYVGVYRFFGKR